MKTINVPSHTEASSALRKELRSYDLPVMYGVKFELPYPHIVVHTFEKLSSGMEGYLITVCPTGWEPAREKEFTIIKITDN